MEETESQRWEATWNEFIRALHSTDDFDAFHWVIRLASAGSSVLYARAIPSGARRSISNALSSGGWRPLVPAFGISLVCATVASYYFSLRRTVKERWCSCDDAIGSDAVGGDRDGCASTPCSSIHFHDAMILYTGMMILFNYISTASRTPGCMPSQTPAGVSAGVPPSSSMTSGQTSWMGCFSSRKRASQDTKCVELYCESWNAFASNKANQPIALPRWVEDKSSCAKCGIASRPPRCHHCRICRRCVLRYDHHCVWMANCIGFNNYREFILTLFFITVASSYLVVLLINPFLNVVFEYNRMVEPLGIPMMQQFLEFWSHSPSHSPSSSLSSTSKWEQDAAVSSRLAIDPVVAIKVVFPFVCFIAAVHGCFLSIHLMYMAYDVTTLEHKIMMDSIADSASQRTTPTSLLRSLHHLVGPNLFLALLPIPVAVSPPVFQQHRRKDE